jgi:hypothetical protein
VAARFGLFWTADYEACVEEQQTCVFAEAGDAGVPRIVQVQGGQLCGGAQASKDGVLPVKYSLVHTFPGFWKFGNCSTTRKKQTKAEEIICHTRGVIIQT